MITDYEIRGIKGDETLYLYLDFSLEFAKLGSKAKEKKIGEVIRDFLKEKNIKFDGKKVAVISGGLLVATLLLNSPSANYDSSSYLANDYQSSVVLLDESALMPEAEVTTETKEETVLKSEFHPDLQKVDTNVNSNTPKIASSGTNANSTSAPKKETVTSPKTDTTGAQVKSPSVATKPAETPESEVKETEVTPKDEAIYVAVKRTNGTVISLELEEYVIGVVGAEMPAAFNKEALKVQAIIARTYALKAIETGRTLTDDSSTQNYKSNEQLRAMWGSTYQTYYQKVRSAVTETKGMFLVYNDVIIDAVYHSTSNGRTEDSKYVWGNAFPYLVSVESPYDQSNSSFEKVVTLTFEDVSAKLGFDVNAETDIKILSKTSGDRVLNITFGNILLNGVTVRNKLGLRSADFDIVKTETGLTFTTRGYGHGVGLSQYGANGMANHGYDCASILKHYYKGVSISHL